MFGFGQPQFLFAALGLAVPVVLHLMKRQVAVNVTFPSIRFIRKGRLPKTGRRRLRDVFLLLLRLLLFALLVLALARLMWIPRTPATAGVADAEASERIVFLVDASASMAGWNSMDQVKQQIRTVIDRNRSAAYGLVMSARGPERVVDLGSSLRSIEQALDDIESLPYAGMHVRSLETAAGMLQEAGGGTLYIASDFQASDWNLPQVQRLPESVRLVLLRPEAERGSNLAIMNVRSEVVPDGSTRVIVELRNQGSTEQTARLHLNAGTTSQSQTVTVPAQRPFRTAFSVQDLGTVKGELRLESADAYQRDDTYMAWLGGQPPVRVLMVIPGEAEPQKERELFFLRKALEVQSQSGARPFVVQEVEANLFWSLQPESQDALVFLGALGHMDDQGVDVLKQYLAEGGVALCTPSGKSGRQFMQLRRHGLLDADYRGVWNVANRYRDATAVGWMDQESILGNIFEDPQDTDLFLFPIYQFVQVRAGAGAHVLLRTEEDDPLLLEQDYKKGVLYVSTIGFTPAWSDLPMSSIFLPLVRELLTVRRQAESGVLRVACGDPLPVLSNLAGDTISGSALSAESATTEPGVLVIDETPVEINVSRRESGLEQRSLLALRDQLTAETGSADAGLTRAAASKDSQRAIALWPWLAAVAAVLALIELLLAFLLDRAGLQKESSRAAVGAQAKPIET